MPFRVIRQDLTRVEADAIVNTANPSPVFGRGTDEAIYLAAGAEELLAERRKIGEMVPGQAAVTSAFGLSAKYLIHTVGPRWQGGDAGEADILRQCYRNCLKTAEELACESIAFPLISTGSYRFPADLGLQIALSEIQAYLMNSEMMVLLVVYSEQAYELSTHLFADVESYIDRNYILEAEKKQSVGRGMRAGGSRHSSPRSAARPELSGAAFSEDGILSNEMPVGSISDEPFPEGAASHFEELMSEAAELPTMQMPNMKKQASQKSKHLFRAPEPKKRKLDELMSQVGETFQERLFRLIEEKGMKNSDVYKGANMGKQHFSKLKNNVDYQPKKQTVMALAIALHLNMDETIDLMSRAGYAFSPSSRQDLAVQYFIENQIYDIFRIEVTLDSLGLPTLCNYG